MHETEAWVLSAGARRRPGEPVVPGELEKAMFSFPAITEDEVLAEPIYGSWEGNMSHALARKPVDVCQLRGEDKIVLGNAGVGRVLRAGANVKHLVEGDCFLITPRNQKFNDAFGYPVRAHGYDAPGTIGLLAKRIKLSGATCERIPPDSGFSLLHWAAFGIRYPTAWSNWRVALGAYRSQMTEADLASPHVWGWGGGCTLAELDLARREGCRPVMLSGSDVHLATIRSLGIEAVDRREFPDLHFDEARYQADPNYRASFNESESLFLQLVKERTQGLGVSIFVDYIGEPLARVTTRALGRQAVITTAGWMLGTNTPLNRSVACIKRHMFVHTHGARSAEVQAAMSYAIATGWMPPLGSKVYAWDEILELARAFSSSALDTYFPLYQVNAV
jgi:NADPH:quinone reductase-like Zn-dependent oxidoreductase